MTAAVAFQNLTLGYDRHPAVHHLQAGIAEKSLTAIVGPNGAGKSPLLKGVIGTLAPLEGRVAFGTLAREDIAYLPQQSDIDRSFPLSVVDLVAMGLWREIGPFGRLGPDHRERVAAAISAVGLTGFEARPIGSLSGGQMQRALLGCIAVSVGATPVGVFLMLPRMSLIGDAMAHAILPGAVVGFLVAGLSLGTMTVGGLIAGMAVALLSGFVTRVTALREDASLAGEGRFDYLLIESTGISEPLPVVATFDFRDKAGESLSDVARLDTMVAVVDAVNLLKDYSSHDFLRDPGETMGDEDERALVHLLTDQIEFADVVILNKIADATPEQVDAARKIIRSLNADARIIETNHCNVPAEAILNTGLFDLQKAHEHPMWAKELYGFIDHVPETEEYGVTSYVYRARLPFEPEKIMAVLNGEMPGVIRAKGHFWIATRPDWVAEFSLAGTLSGIKPLGIWGASVPKDRWPDHDSARAYLDANWQEPWGDRRQEIIFIGSGIDWPTLKAQLDAALLPAVVAGDPDAWPDLPDPFPVWRRTEAAA